MTEQLSLHRGRGIATSALQALTAFAWTIPGLYRVELYIEPWNTSDMLLYATTRPECQSKEQDST